MAAKTHPARLRPPPSLHLRCKEGLESGFQALQIDIQLFNLLFEFVIKAIIV
jgi:hypothetical protein